MKRKTLLFGLIVAAFVGGAHFASAQPKANYHNNLIEIGPDNVAGRVRAIVVDNADPMHTTLYAGGVSGGLFKKIGNAPWQYVPFMNSNNQQITLPISCMVQLPNNNLLIGTGEGFLSTHGINFDRMSPKGRGLYVFNPDNGTFTLVPSTDPQTHPEWTYINRIAILQRDATYIYVATSEGLYRWKLNNSNPDWNQSPSLVKAGNFQDVLIVSADNIVYATGPGDANGDWKICRVGNATATNPTANDITNSFLPFITSSRIEMAYQSDHANGLTYLYAVVADSIGMLDGVFLTTNQQTWTRLSTSSVAPFTKSNLGKLSSSIAVDPMNCKNILVGGATLWNGEGFVPNSNYQWTKQSYSEKELNAGNYMATVPSTPVYIHSGIHQILPTWTIVDGDTTWIYYFATDGGVFKGVNTKIGSSSSWVFTPINKGLNNVQFNHIAVAPDGSIIGGAVDNSCPFIQSRNAHNGSVPTNSWYDNDTNSVINHTANILWTGSGADVATSMFQQLKPYSRRTLFVSSDPGFFSHTDGMGTTGISSFGRTCDDYADFTNTQTWTSGENFLGKSNISSNPIPKMDIWETTNNTIWDDSITFDIDTNLIYMHNGEETQLHGNTVFVKGDSILVASKAQFNYPFYHKFQRRFQIDTTINYYDSILKKDTFRIEYRTRLTVPCPVVSRMIVNGHNSSGQGCVFFSLTPTNFHYVYDPTNGSSATSMRWGTIYLADKGSTVGDIAFSRDGKSIFVVVSDDNTGDNYIMRFYNFNKINANEPSEMPTRLKFGKNVDSSGVRVVLYDTIKAANGDFFKRPISSINVDPRAGQDNLLITFAGYGSNEPNMALVENASDTNRQVRNLTVTFDANGMTVADPVHSGIIAVDKNNNAVIYAGTEKGVFTSTSLTSPSWQNYGDFIGVPVTSIVQQTRNLKRQSYIARDGVNDVQYLFAKTKYPRAIYFGTYGRGIFMDTTYVTDRVNEVSDSNDWVVGIATVDNGDNYVKIYPNPAIDRATIDLGIVNSGNAVIKIYDVTGKMVFCEDLGYLNEGMHQYTVNCNKFNRGIYLVNVNVGKESATSKLIVR